MAVRVYTLEPNIQIGFSNKGNLQKLYNTSNDLSIQFRAHQLNIYILILSISLLCAIYLFCHIKRRN